MSNFALSETPILPFWNNAGQPNVGGKLLTQVGGVNYPTYQDGAGLTPLPNPIPLNSRGEISNSSGISCQLFLVPDIVYTFTLFDAHGNQIWTADDVMAITPVAVGNMTDEPPFSAGPIFTGEITDTALTVSAITGGAPLAIGQTLFGANVTTGTTITAGSGTSWTVSESQTVASEPMAAAGASQFAPGFSATLPLSQNYGSASNLWVDFDAAAQGSGTFTLGGGSNETLTFNEPIPFGVEEVYVKGGSALTIGTPAAGTVTDSSVAAGTALYNRIADVINPLDPQFGAKFDGKTDDTAALQSALNALTSGRQLVLPPGTAITGPLTLPTASGVGHGYIIQGAGIGNTILQEKTAGAGIFGAPSGIVFAAELSDFSVQCATGADGGGCGILLSGYYNTKFSRIGYLSNGAGFWANLFLVAASPELSYGNTIEDVHIFQQIGPGVPISFGNNNLGVNFNANACRIVGGIIANNTKVGTAIDCTRSINTVIDRVWLESNYTTATVTGNQADAAAGINVGQGTAVTDCYLEAHNPYIQYPSVADGPSNNGVCKGNTFAPSWQTTTPFFNGANGNLWVGNNEGGLPVIFSGAAGVNWKIGATVSLAAALALIPAITYSGGTNGSLVNSSDAVVVLDASGDITFRWNLTWTPLASAANDASIFNIAAVTGYTLKTLSVTSNIPVLNSLPMPCSVDLSSSSFVASVSQPGSPDALQGIFVQAAFAKAW